MYDIRFSHQRGSERSNMARFGGAVHSLVPISLIPIVDSDLKVARICPLSNRNGIHNMGDFITAGGN